MYGPFQHSVIHFAWLVNTIKIAVNIYSLTWIAVHGILLKNKKARYKAACLYGFIKRYLILIKKLLCANHCLKHFTCIKSINFNVPL